MARLISTTLSVVVVLVVLAALRASALTEALASPTIIAINGAPASSLAEVGAHFDSDAEVESDVEVDTDSDSHAELDSGSATEVDVDADADADLATSDAAAAVSEHHLDLSHESKLSRKPASSTAAKAPKAAKASPTKSSTKKTTSKKPSARSILRNSTYTNLDDEFDHFIKVFRKTYANDKAKRAAKKAIYLKKRAEIAAHNKAFKEGKATYTRRITMLADQSAEDMVKRKTNPDLAKKLAAAAATNTSKAGASSAKPRFQSVVTHKVDQQPLPSYGGANKGGANKGGADSGAANKGGANKGGSADGGANKGGANKGGADSGAANKGGANKGGANKGGSDVSTLARQNVPDGSALPRPVDDASFPNLRDTKNYFTSTKPAPKVFDQGKDGLCYVYSVVTALQYQAPADQFTAKLDPKYVGELATRLAKQLYSGQNARSTAKNSALYTGNTKDGGYAQYVVQFFAEAQMSWSNTKTLQVNKTASMRDDPIHRYAPTMVIGARDATDFKAKLNKYGPAVINIDARGMSTYSGGVFQSQSVAANDGSLPMGDHFVVAVGYGVDSKTGQEYIIVQNSWGVNWGDNGFGRIPINAFDRQTVLFIISSPK